MGQTAVHCCRQDEDTVSCRVTASRESLGTSFVRPTFPNRNFRDQGLELTRPISEAVARGFESSREVEARLRDAGKVGDPDSGADGDSHVPP